MADHEHTHEDQEQAQAPGNRQVPWERVLESLKRQIGELHVELALRESLIEDLEIDLKEALDTIDKLAPTEGITDAPSD